MTVTTRSATAAVAVPSVPAPAPPVAAEATPAVAPAAPFLPPLPAAGSVAAGALTGVRAGAAPALVGSLERSAATHESAVMTTARALAAAPGNADLRAQLEGEFAAWQKSVAALLQAGAPSSLAAKRFLAVVQQASLVNENVPPGTDPLTFTAAAESVVRAISVDAAGEGLRAVVEHNPLLLVPTLAEPHTPEHLAERGVPLVDAAVRVPGGGMQRGPVRSDVVTIFCPGVITDGEQFLAQSQAALEAGMYGVRAPTGTFVDPEENAKIIEQAIADARAAVGNPNAKVVLLGYSQGSTNVFEFMRDPNNHRAAVTKDVIAIHSMHGAARGSQIIDAVIGIRKIIAGETLTPPETAAADAFARAAGATLGQPRIGEQLVQLRHAFQALDTVLRPFSELVSRVVGGGPAEGPRLVDKLLPFALANDDWTKRLAEQGLLGRAAAAAVGPPWRALLESPLMQVLRAPSIRDLVGGKLAGLRSLSTAYGDALMRDPKTAQQTASIPILNTVGAVPPDRRAELVSRLNDFNYELFQQLGLPSDAQVAVGFQQLGGVLPNAVDMPVQAIAHWGVAGLNVPLDHDERYFRHYSPTGLVRAMLSTLQAAGTI